MSDSQLLKSRNDRLVVEKLRHAAALRDDFDGSRHQFITGIFMKSDGQIGLRKTEGILSVEEQEGQIV